MVRQPPPGDEPPVAPSTGQGPRGDIPPALAPPGPRGQQAIQHVTVMLRAHRFAQTSSPLRWWRWFEGHGPTHVFVQFQLARQLAHVWALNYTDGLLIDQPVPPPYRPRVPYYTVDLAGYHANPAEVVAYAIGLALGPGGIAVDWRPTP